MLEARSQGLVTAPYNPTQDYFLLVAQDTSFGFISTLLGQ